MRGGYCKKYIRRKTGYIKDVYKRQTHTFHGCREDAYDSLGIRVIYEERKDDPDILGFIDRCV